MRNHIQSERKSIKIPDQNLSATLREGSPSGPYGLKKGFIDEYQNPIFSNRPLGATGDPKTVDSGDVPKLHLWRESVEQTATPCDQN